MSSRATKFARLSCIAATSLMGCREPPTTSSQPLTPRGSAAGSAAGASTPPAAARAAPAASAEGSVFAPSPSAALHAAPSVLAIHLGDTQATLTQLLGPCEAAPGADGVCVYWQRGLELELSSGRVQRMVAHQAGDPSLLADGRAKGRFGLFRQTIGQVQIGMSADALLNVLGAPDQRLLPLGNNPGRDAGIWEYPKRGLAVEVEPVDGEPQVVRIHVPLAPARPAR